MQHFGKHEVAFFKQESWSQKLKSGKTEAEGFFFFHVNALTNANKVLINLLDGWQLLTQQQQPDVITAFCVFFLFLLLSLNIFSFFFYMERNKEQHLARTCAVFFKRRLEQTWFCGTLGNRSERLSSGKLWANINEAFKLEKEKNTHPFLKKKKVWAAWRPAAEQRDRNIFYQQAPPTPPTLRGHRLIGAERQWQLGLMEPTTRKKKKTHCGWEGDVSVRFNLKGFNKSGRIGGRQRQCGLSVFTLTSASSRRVKKKKKKGVLLLLLLWRHGPRVTRWGGEKTRPCWLPEVSPNFQNVRVHSLFELNCLHTNHWLYMLSCINTKCRKWSRLSITVKNLKEYFTFKLFFIYVFVHICLQSCKDSFQTTWFSISISAI